MALESLQSHILINWFNHKHINQPVQMAAVNHVIRPFEGTYILDIGYTTGLKIYLQAKKEIDKETYKLDIPVSNSKDIIYHLLSLYKNMDGDALHSW